MENKYFKTQYRTSVFLKKYILGLATLMKDNTMPTQIGTTWRSSKPSEDLTSMRPGTSPALHQNMPSSPTGSSSSSSDSSIGD